MSESESIASIELSGVRVLVKWEDGHHSNFDAKYLRVQCACAECVEEWSQRKLLDPASVPADLCAEDYLMVGRYAVQFLWSDAHHTGIYPFTFFRSLRTCEDCTSSSIRK